MFHSGVKITKQRPKRKNDFQFCSKTFSSILFQLPVFIEESLKMDAKNWFLNVAEMLFMTDIMLGFNKLSPCSQAQLQHGKPPQRPSQPHRTVTPSQVPPKWQVSIYILPVVFTMFHIWCSVVLVFFSFSCKVCFSWFDFIWHQNVFIYQ